MIDPSVFGGVSGFPNTPMRQIPRDLHEDACSHAVQRFLARLVVAAFFGPHAIYLMDLLCERFMHAQTKLPKKRRRGQQPGSQVVPGPRSTVTLKSRDLAQIDQTKDRVSLLARATLVPIQKIVNHGRQLIASARRYY